MYLSCCVCQAEGEQTGCSHSGMDIRRKLFHRVHHMGITLPRWQGKRSESKYPTYASKCIRVSPWFSSSLTHINRYKDVQILYISVPRLAISFARVKNTDSGHVVGFHLGTICLSFCSEHIVSGLYCSKARKSSSWEVVAVVCIICTIIWFNIVRM